MAAIIISAVAVPAMVPCTASTGIRKPNNGRLRCYVRNWFGCGSFQHWLHGGAFVHLTILFSFVW